MIQSQAIIVCHSALLQWCPGMPLVKELVRNLISACLTLHCMAQQSMGQLQNEVQDKSSP